MKNLLISRDDVISYLNEKQDEIKNKSREAKDLGNEEGAKILRLVSEQLTAALRYIVDVPFCK